MDTFTHTVWDYYHAHGRSMPWRDTPTFYNVLVSEIMLQQTQVGRVMEKYKEFMGAFPTVELLATAPLDTVLRQWQGLGYNRRALYLHQAAKLVVKHGVSRSIDDLVTLPGVGRNTAAAIMNYVYNIATPFVETNIRTVYFYHYFPGRTDVTDAEVLEIVGHTVSKDNPREWFWALMDYGSYLKAQGAGGLSTSRHYKKQSRFEGSVRQVRGRILVALLNGGLSDKQLRAVIVADERYEAALEGLSRDNLISFSAGRYHLTK